MKIKNKKIEEQIHLLYSAGFVVSLFTLLVSSLKSSVFSYLIATVLVAGMQLCWKFKVKGFLASVGILFLMAVDSLLKQDLGYALWDMGVLFSAAISLFTLLLTIDDSNELLSKVEFESQSRLDNLLQLDEKVHKTMKSHETEKEELKDKVLGIEKELSAANEKVCSFEKLNRIIKDELSGFVNKYNESVNVITNLKKQLASSEEKELLNASELKTYKEHVETVESLLEFAEEEKKSSDKNYLLAQEELKRTNENVTQLKESLLLNADKINELQKCLEEKNAHISLESQKNESLVNDLNEKLVTYQNQLEESENEQKNLEEKLKKEQTKKTAKKDSGELREVQGKYNQLKDQFEEKSKVLDDTRRAIFRMQEKLMNVQREYEESKKSEKKELEAVFEEHLKKMELERNRLIEDHELEIEGLNQVIASLSEKIELHV